MVNDIRFDLEPETLPRYPLPDWCQSYGDGLIYAHQWNALTTDATRGRIHTPTGTGKSTAASFFAVSPFLRNKDHLIRGTFCYPTNLLTLQQFNEGLLKGLVEYLGFSWQHSSDREPYTWTRSLDDATGGQVGFKYWRLRTPNGEPLFIAWMTGEAMVRAIAASVGARVPGKCDLLLEFMTWLNERNSFLVTSPDLLAFASHEAYGTTHQKYRRDKQRRLSNLLRGRTVVIDEYHMYDPFTLVNIERLLEDDFLRPSRVLLLSATSMPNYFPEIPHDLKGSSLPKEVDEFTPTSKVSVTLRFAEIPEPFEQPGGLSLWIHNSVVENRRRAQQLRNRGIRVVQWDGTRKDDYNSHTTLVLGTQAIEVGLHLPCARYLFTEWWPSVVSASQIIQRIGRIGRESSDSCCEAHIFIPPDEGIFSGLSTLEGKRIKQSCLREILESVRPPRLFLRERQVSWYFGRESEPGVRQSLGLRESDTLRYSFRIPGTQALFVDIDGMPFVYEEEIIRRRYDVAPAVREEVPDEWARFAEGIGIDENRFFRIRDMRQGKPVKKKMIPTGEVDDLKKFGLRHLYVKTSMPVANDDRFI